MHDERELFDCVRSSGAEVGGRYTGLAPKATFPGARGGCARPRPPWQPLGASSTRSSSAGRRSLRAWHVAHARPNSPSRARARARRLQTHGASRAKQYEEWSQLIRNYCKAKKLFVISVNDASTGDLFCNREIGRALPQASIVELLEQLVSEGYAEWEGGGKEQCVVYWRKPSEWAELIAARVRPATRAPDAPAPVPPLTPHAAGGGDGARGPDLHPVRPHPRRLFREYRYGGDGRAGINKGSGDPSGPRPVSCPTPWDPPKAAPSRC